VPTARAWTVVVAVKPLRRAKSRLAPLPPTRRAQLALAMALDTIAAARTCPLVAAVVVVTSDATVATEAARLGASVTPDEPAQGLNAAFCRGLQSLSADAAAALLMGDLPALRCDDVERALSEVDAIIDGVGVVPDAHGTGSTMLASRRAQLLRPAFGPASFARHVDAGAIAIQRADINGLRQDVDEVADIDAVLRLGVGTHTAAVLAAAGYENRTAYESRPRP